MDVLNFGTAFAVIMQKMGRSSSSFRAYMQFRLAGESEMKAALLQIKNLTHSEVDDEPTSEIVNPS